MAGLRGERKVIDAPTVRHASLIGLTLAALSYGAGSAEQPMPEAANEIWSPDGSFCALFDQDTRTTTVFAVPRTWGRFPLWRVPGRVLHGWLSVGGDALATLIEKTETGGERFDSATPVLLFHFRARRTRTITLGDLFPRGPPPYWGRFPFRWGRVIGQEAGGILRIGVGSSHLVEQLADAGRRERYKLMEEADDAGELGWFERVTRLRMVDAQELGA